MTKATFTAISNAWRGSGDQREEEATAILWTLWGKAADNAAAYLSKGSHVNISGRVQNNNYDKDDGTTVYGMAFTAEQVDYLDSKATSEALRLRQDGAQGDQGQHGQHGRQNRTGTSAAAGAVGQGDHVWGEASHDIRVSHKGDAMHEVIDGAVRVLQHFDAVDESVDTMKALSLNRDEERAFATAALALRDGEPTKGDAPPPVTAEQLTQPHRMADVGPSLWLSLQRVQENVARGGLSGRSAQGRRTTTRPVQSIDRSVSLNRALWALAEEMRHLKA